MNESLNDTHSEIVKMAVVGNKKSQHELVTIAERLLSEADVAGAAAMFKEAAIAFRISAFRLEGQLQEAEARLSTAKADIHFWEVCAESRLISSKTDSKNIPGLTSQILWEILPDLPDLVARGGWLTEVLAYYSRVLTELEVPLFSPGGTAIRRMGKSLDCYFSFCDPIDWLRLDDFRVIACVEQFASAVVAAWHERS